MPVVAGRGRARVRADYLGFVLMSSRFHLRHFLDKLRIGTPRVMTPNTSRAAAPSPLLQRLASTDTKASKPPARPPKKSESQRRASENDAMLEP